MELKRLFTDDQAVSPVVGVTMMIAIAVVLAAVVGALVLGLGQGQGATPTASFAFDQTGSTDGSIQIDATHDGGDELNLKNVKVVVDGSGTSAGIGTSGTWTAGQSKTLTTDAASGDVVRIVWSAPNSDKTTVLGEVTVE